MTKHAIHMEDEITSLKRGSNIGQDVQDIIESKRQLAEDTYNKVKDSASDYYDQGMHKAARLEKNFEKKVRENPIKSLAIAAGAGLVLGAILGRRR
jgi:ElaB/YqjD/DUF883 family membrane-anchored ribosome-binding protein